MNGMGWPLRVIAWWVAWQLLVYCAVRLITGSAVFGVVCACVTAWTLNKDRVSSLPP